MMVPSKSRTNDDIFINNCADKTLSEAVAVPVPTEAKLSPKNVAEL